MPENEKEFNFEDLEIRAQEVIVDLLASIIINNEKDRKEE